MAAARHPVPVPASWAPTSCLLLTSHLPTHPPLQSPGTHSRMCACPPWLGPSACRCCRCRRCAAAAGAGTAADVCQPSGRLCAAQPRPAPPNVRPTPVMLAAVRAAGNREPGVCLPHGGGAARCVGPAGLARVARCAGEGALWRRQGCAVPRAAGRTRAPAVLHMQAQSLLRACAAACLRPQPQPLAPSNCRPPACSEPCWQGVGAAPQAHRAAAHSGALPAAGQCRRIPVSLDG